MHSLRYFLNVSITSRLTFERLCAREEKRHHEGQQQHQRQRNDEESDIDIAASAGRIGLFLRVFPPRSATKWNWSLGTCWQSFSHFYPQSAANERIHELHPYRVGNI